MKNHDMTEFAQLLTAIAALYKHSINELVMDIYWQALMQFEWVDIKQSFYAHVNNPDSGQFMPKPADILRYLNGDSETQALQAWSRVLQTLHDIGSYESIVFDDPILHRVIEDIGGWISLSERTDKEMSFLVHEFKKRYAAYVLHPPTSYPPQLIGRFGWHNNRLGYPSEPPLLIGDPKKAEQVYQQGRTTALPRSLVRLSLSQALPPSIQAKIALSLDVPTQEKDACTISTHPLNNT